MKTQLKDRTLWFDGTNEVNPDLVPSLLLCGIPLSKISATYKNEDIQKFELLSEEQIAIGKNNNSKFSFNWNIPSEFQQMDLMEYSMSLVDSFPQVYKTRMEEELKEIKNRKLEDLFKTLIFVIDNFKKNNVVWGVGRGSSCASLLLYMLGLHMVDPIKFDIPLSEFFHD